MALSHNEIVATIGPADESLIAEIVAINPSTEELLQAWTWLGADEALINEGRSLPSGKVAQLIELLSPSEDDEDQLRQH
jgi:hypothetical protein